MLQISYFQLIWNNVSVQLQSVYLKNAAVQPLSVYILYCCGAVSQRLYGIILQCSYCQFVWYNAEVHLLSVYFE